MSEMQDRAVSRLSTREIQDELYKMLLEFDAICNDNNLRYSIYAGTLLGAVRHGGFIPWDDDVDVAMPRRDYDAFIALSQNGELPPNRAVITGHNTPFPFAFAKYVNKEIRVETNTYKHLAKEYLWLDVFPVDQSFETVQEMNAYVRKRQRLLTLAYITTRKSKSFVKQTVKQIVAAFIGKRWPAQKCVTLIEKEARVMGGHDTGHVAMMAFGAYGSREWFDQSLFERYIKIPFNSSQLMAVADWDTCLKQLYGDYMTLPPINQRVTHELIAWNLSDENAETERR